MNYETKTVVQLKEICKKKNISGYSKLNKKELISFIKKNLKKGGEDPDFESGNGDLVFKPGKFFGNKNYNNTEILIKPKEKMFYDKYKKYEYLHDKLKYYFDHLFEFQKFKNFNNNYFKPEELKKLTYIERYFLFLEEESSLFSRNNKLLSHNHLTNKKTEYYKVIYIKTENNHKRNTSYMFKNTSKNIKIIKLQNNLSYINKMINYFNKYTYKSQTGSCMTGIRLRINKIKNNEWDTISYKTKFNDEQFCIPTNNPYIQKIYINNKQNYHIGDEYELKKNNNNN